MQLNADLESTLLGPVIDGRSCGDCTVCCTTLRVDTPDFQKRENTPCSHLGSHGCRIHAVRPHICRTWFCAWRRVTSMADDTRPDRSGLLVFVNFARAPRNCFEAISITVRLLPGSTAIADGTAGRVLDSLCEDLVPVWFSDGTRQVLMHPENDVAKHVLAGTDAPRHLRDEVDAWRERYVTSDGGIRTIEA